MSPTWTTFVFEAINFLVLAAVLGWLLFRPVRQALERRRATLTHEAEDIAAQRTEVEQLQHDIQQRRASLEAELDRMRHDTLAAVQQEAERIRAEARTAVEREHEAARNRLAHLDEAQQERLATAVAAVAGAAVERLLEQLGGPALDHSLVQGACRALRDLDGVALGAVTVESAQPLDQEMQTQLLEVLGQAAQPIEFRVSPTLGAGLRISTSQGLVDASAVGLAAFARRTLSEELDTLQHG